MDVILRADSLYHIYESNAEDGNVVALRGLSVSIGEGEAVAVVGPSGSGKSTLLKCLGALMKPSAGSVELAGRRVTRLTGPELVSLRQQTVSFIFQDSNLLPHLNALNNVAQPLLHQGELARPSRKKAQELLDRLGVGDRAMGMPEQLSGGEQQRVAIARALITNPKLILADEPTGALDPITSREVLALFKQLHKEDGVAFLLVTHSKEVAAFCERSLELREGRFIAQHGGDVDIADLSDSQGADSGRLRNRDPASRRAAGDRGPWEVRAARGVEGPAPHGEGGGRPHLRRRFGHDEALQHLPRMLPPVRGQRRAALPGMR